MLEGIYFADPFGLAGQVEKEAQALYDEFRSLPESKLPVLSKLSLAMAKMYTAYALYLIRQQQGSPAAKQLLKEIVKLDPDCVLAARA